MPYASNLGQIFLARLTWPNPLIQGNALLALRSLQGSIQSYIIYGTWSLKGSELTIEELLFGELVQHHIFKRIF